MLQLWLFKIDGILFGIEKMYCLRKTTFFPFQHMQCHWQCNVCPRVIYVSNHWQYSILFEFITLCEISYFLWKFVGGKILVFLVAPRVTQIQCEMCPVALALHVCQTIFPHMNSYDQTTYRTCKKWGLNKWTEHPSDTDYQKRPTRTQAYLAIFSKLSSSIVISDTTIWS